MNMESMAGIDQQTEVENFLMQLSQERLCSVASTDNAPDIAKDSRTDELPMQNPNPTLPPYRSLPPSYSSSMYDSEDDRYVEQ